MSVLSREALEASPLADLHEIASGLDIDGYRRLRKADLVDRLIEAQGGDPSVGKAPTEAADSDAVEGQSDRRSSGREPRSRNREPRSRQEGRGESRKREERTRAAEAPESVEG